MKYEIKCRAAQREAIEATEWEQPLENIAGDYVEAESEEEAVELFKQWIFDNAEGDKEITDDAVEVYENGELIEKYYDFTVAKAESPIKAARIKAGLTQQLMSDLMDIPKRTIGDWETGKSTPPSYVEKLVVAELERIGEKMTYRTVYQEWDSRQKKMHRTILFEGSKLDCEDCKRTFEEGRHFDGITNGVMIERCEVKNENSEA